MQIKPCLRQFGVNVSCNVCATCKRNIGQSKVPSLSYCENLLNLEWVPSCLNKLSKRERRLVAKINIFMTVVMLSGWQYAEKGLVLNLPSNAFDMMCDLPCSMHDTPYVVIKFRMSRVVCQK